MPGLGLGWIGGYNITKQKRLLLYLETGFLMNVGGGECLTEEDVFLNLEVPINVTYRYNFKNSKIYVAPYFGFHFKLNALWKDEDSYFGDYWSDYLDTRRDR